MNRRFSPASHLLSSGAETPPNSSSLKEAEGRLNALLNLAKLLEASIFGAENPSAKLVEAYLKTLSQIREEMALLVDKQDVDGSLKAVLEALKVS